MNCKYLLLPLTVCSALAMAGEPEAQNYVYGMPLDIDKVITISEPAAVCGVVTAQMTYEDSQGVQRELDYQKWSTGCGIFDDGGLSMGY